MIVSVRTPIGDIVAKQPRAARIFEQHRIDYCCNGSEPLAEACDGAGADSRLVLAQLARAEEESSLERDWTMAPLADLVDHILSVYHASLRKDLLSIVESADATLLPLFLPFRGELEQHLRREEEEVFPVILLYEREADPHRLRQSGRFGSIRSAAPSLAAEHRTAHEAIKAMRAAAAITAHASRVDAIGASSVDFCRLEADLHRHIHLENNILFPRAIALEEAYE